jgi:hypothetical protein
VPRQDQRTVAIDQVPLAVRTFESDVGCLLLHRVRRVGWQGAGHDLPAFHAHGYALPAGDGLDDGATVRASPAMLTRDRVPATSPDRTAMLDCVPSYRSTITRMLVGGTGPTRHVTARSLGASGAPEAAGDPRSHLLLVDESRRAACANNARREAWRPYWTTSDVVALALVPPIVQRTVTGQLPGVVREPTVQLQDTTPLALAVLGPRPAALEGPDL